MREPPRSPLQEQVRLLTPTPMHTGRPWTLRFGAAAVAWSVALAMTLQLAPQIQRSSFVFFWVAILFAAWYSGLVPALLCAVGSILAVNFFLIDPTGRLTMPEAHDLLMLFVFLCVSTAVSALTVRLAEEERATRARAAELAHLNERMALQQRELAARTEAAHTLVQEAEAANAGLAVVNTALEESEQRWQMLTEIAPVFIWTTDADGNCTWVNRSWREFTGQDIQDVVGNGWTAPIHPDDAARIRRDFAAAVTARTPCTLEYRLRSRDGEYRWVTDRGVPRFSDDRVFLGHIGSCIDISERRAAEEWSHALQALGASLTGATHVGEVAESALRDAASAVGADACRLALRSPDGERLETVEPRKAEGGVVSSAVGGRLAEDAPEWTALRTGSSVVACTREVGGSGHDGVAGTAAVAVIAIPVTVDEQCEAVMTFTFPAGRDFADEELAFIDAVVHLCAQALARVRLFEAEQRARHEADAANRAKSDFLAQLSHELRTPLNAVGGYTDLIAMGIHGPVTEEQRTALERLKRAQQELLTHIDELLTYARIDRAPRSYAFTAVRAEAILREVEALVAPQAGGKGIALRIEPSDPALCGWGDADRVRQILLNLVTNAIKYTPAGGRVVLVARGRMTAAGVGRVDFEVSDTGRGIPADKLDTIFDPFVQLSRTPFEPREGVGLGLAISRRLAADMDGELTVTSEEGVGSTFRLSLREATEAGRPALQRASQATG